MIVGNVTVDVPLRCILITDARNTVIGVATTLPAKSSSGDTPRTVFRGLAPAGHDAYRVFVVVDGDPRRVPGEIEAGDIDETP